MNATQQRKVNSARTVTAGMFLGHVVPSDNPALKFKSRNITQLVQRKIREDVLRIQALPISNPESESLGEAMEKLGETKTEVGGDENLVLP